MTAYPVRRFMPWRGSILERWDSDVKVFTGRSGAQIIIREDGNDIHAKRIDRGKPGKEIKLPEP